MVYNKCLSLQSCKALGLEILIDVHSFCEKNNLKYVLFYGTLLGAIRHNGYIPWDDDIDIAMPRSDYELFIKTYKSNHFGVIDCNANSRYWLPWAKVFDKNTIKVEPIPPENECNMGLSIDIFPLDLVDSVKQYQAKKKKETRLIRKWLLSLNVEKGLRIKTMIKRILSIPYKGKANLLAKSIDSFFASDKTDSGGFYIANEVYWRNPDYVFDNTIFSERELHVFENNLFFIPKNYDSVLKTCYGNYMELPPESQRNSHHSFDVFEKSDERL